jgi:hypothetical protein
MVGRPPGRRSAALALGLALCCAAACTPTPPVTADLTHLGSLRLDVRLSPPEFATVAPTADDFGVASDGGVFLSSGRGVVEVEPGDRPGLVLGAAETGPDSLAVGADDAMPTIAKGFLGVLGDDGQPVAGVPMLCDQQRVAPSARPGAFYLLCNKDGQGFVYRFLSAGTVEKLFATDTPLVAVTDTPGDVYVATPHLVLKLGEGGSRIVFQSPSDATFPPIVSIAASSDGLLFIGTADRVYVSVGGSALSIVNDSGGSLRWRNDALYVLDRQRGMLYALSPATTAMFDQASG